MRSDPAVVRPGAQLDRWVLGLRGARNAVDPSRPYAFHVETEPGPDGTPGDVATVFLTNRECPFRCVMCDLWRNTLEETVPPGAIPAQVRNALERLPSAPTVKLYNAGSFFDPRAIPPGDYPAIAHELSSASRIIVECHPAFVGPRVLEFQRLLGSARLEVAMGLETVHPVVLDRLNKRMTLPQFRSAAGFLAEHGIDLRVFVLVRPPWLSEAEGVEWARRSLDFAAECGAAVSVLIPTRAGNGAMEVLAAAGEFTPPRIESLERALEHGLGLRSGRVFADLWDIGLFAGCEHCAAARIERLRQMNETQAAPAPIECAACSNLARV